MKKYFLLAALFFTSGCATIGKVGDGAGTSHVRVVDSKNNLLHGAQCKVVYRSRTLKFDSPEFSITSNVEFHNYPSISCTKNGYKAVNQKLSKTMNANTLWNVLWLPGFAIDAAAGNMTSLKKNITIKMEKLN